MKFFSGILRRSIIFVLLFAGALIARAGDWSVEKYPFYELPPILDIFDKVEPAGRFTWAKVETIRPAGNLNAAAYFPDGRSLVVGENDGRFLGRVVRWDRRIGGVKWSVRPFKKARYGGYPAARGLVVDESGRHVAFFPWFRAVDKDISLVLLDARTGRTRHRLRLPSTLPGCAGRKNGRRIMLQPRLVRFAGDSLFVYYRNQYGANYSGCSVVDDTWIVKWNPNRGRVIWKHRISANGIPELRVPDRACFTHPNFDVSPDGKVVASGDCNGRILLLDGRTGKRTGMVPSFLRVSRAGKLPGTYRISEITFDPRRPGIAYCVIGEAGRKSLLARVNVLTRVFDKYLLTAQFNDIPSIQMSPDGRVLMAGHSNLFAWDLKLRAAIAVHSGYFPRFNPRVREMMYVSGRDLEFVRLKPISGPAVKPRPWGSTYPSMSDYGGRRGVNRYRRKHPSEIVHAKPKDPDDPASYDWKKWKIEPGKANERLGDAINTARPGQLIAALKAGADPDLKTGIGSPWLTMAAVSKFVLVKIMLDYGANPNSVSDIGYTALMTAAWNGKIKAVRYLVKKGAKVNHQARNGRNALMSAARGCRVEVVRFLVQEARANVFARDKSGANAYRNAVSFCGYRGKGGEIRAILEAAGLKKR